MAGSNRNHTALGSLADAYLAALMTILVFGCGAGGYLTIQNVKWTLFLTLTGGYVALSLLLYLEECMIGRRKLSELRDAAGHASWVHRLMAVFLLWTVLSALLSPFGAAAWLGASRGEGVLTIALYVLSFLFLSCFGRPKKWMLWVLGVTAAAQSILCILQLRGGNPLSIYPAGVNYYDAGKAYSGAYLGTIGNIDFLGTYYCLVLPILWAAMVRLRTPMRFLCLIPLALGVYVVWRMQVLSCWVGLFLGAAAALPFVLPASVRVRRRVGLSLLGVCLAGLAVVFAVDLGGPAGTIHQMLHGEVPQSVDSGRLYIWREALARAVKRPLFGYGPDTMALAQIPPFERYDPELNLLIRGTIDSAHNEYLNVFFHQGIPALAAYLGALAALAALCWKRSRDSAETALLGAAVLSYAIQAFFNISTCIVAPLFWALLGLLTRCAMSNHKSKGEMKK